MLHFSNGIGRHRSECWLGRCLVSLGGSTRAHGGSVIAVGIRRSSGIDIVEGRVGDAGQGASAKPLDHLQLVAGRA